MTHIETCWSGIQSVILGGTSGGTKTCWPPCAVVTFLPRLMTVRGGVERRWVFFSFSSTRESVEIFLRGMVCTFLSTLPATDSRDNLSLTGVDVTGVLRPDSWNGVTLPPIVVEKVGDEEGVWVRVCMMLLQSSVKGESSIKANNSKNEHITTRGLLEVTDNCYRTYGCWSIQCKVIQNKRSFCRKAASWSIIFLLSD